MTDLSRQLRAATLKALSPSDKIDLLEKEAGELHRMVPSYAIRYLKTKFARLHRRRDGSRTTRDS